MVRGSRYLAEIGEQPAALEQLVASAPEIGGCPLGPGRRLVRLVAHNPGSGLAIEQ